MAQSPSPTRETLGIRLTPADIFLTAPWQALLALAIAVAAADIALRAATSGTGARSRRWQARARQAWGLRRFGVLLVAFAALMAQYWRFDVERESPLLWKVQAGLLGLVYVLWFRELYLLVFGGRRHFDLPEEGPPKKREERPFLSDASAGR